MSNREWNKCQENERRAPNGVVQRSTLLFAIIVVQVMDDYQSSHDMFRLLRPTEIHEQSNPRNILVCQEPTNLSNNGEIRDLLWQVRETRIQHHQDLSKILMFKKWTCCT